MSHSIYTHCLSVCLSVSLSLSVCLSVCLSLYSICLSLSINVSSLYRYDLDNHPSGPSHTGSVCPNKTRRLIGHTEPVWEGPEGWLSRSYNVDRERQRERERQTDRQTDRERETDRQTDSSVCRSVRHLFSCSGALSVNLVFVFGREEDERVSTPRLRR